MSVVWHAEAELELVEAAKFYDSRVAGLGANFLKAVETAIADIVVHPNRFAIVEGDIRRCRVRRFPYCVYFRQIGTMIRVLVIGHHSRRPGYWKQRE